MADSTFKEIRLLVPKKNIHSGVRLVPEVSFSFFLLPEISHWERVEGYNFIELIIDRPQQVRKAEIESAFLYVRRWDADNKIFAGDFSMTGHYTDSTGTTIPFNVTDGVFDVTNHFLP